MNKLMLSLGVLTIIISAYGQDNWIRRDSVNGPPRGSCAAFVLDGEGYVIAGVNMEEFKRKMYSYDLEQDDWDDEIALGNESGDGLARGNAIGFSANGYGFAGLGTGLIPYMKDLWRYDDESKTWTQMADFPGSARHGAVAFAIDNVAYVGTGQSESGPEKDFYRYTPTTNSWNAIMDFPGGNRREAVGFTMGGKGYFGTGTDNVSYKQDFWEYDPIGDNWTQKANFPGTPRIGAVGCGAFPSAFLALGEDNGFNYKKDVWEYHYFGDVWSQKTDYPGGPRTEASAFVVDQRVFIGLGYNGNYHDDFYEYQQVVSVEKNEAVDKVLLYPNPAQSIFWLNYEAHDLNNLTFIIFSMDGKDVTNHFELEIQDNRARVMNNAALSGQFLITLTNEQGIVASKKIVLL